MSYGTKSYPLDCPDLVWQALKEVQQTENNINDELVVAVAAHVDDRADDPGVALSDDQRAAVDTILNQS